MTESDAPGGSTKRINRANRRADEMVAAGLVTPEEAAKFLNVGRATLYVLIGSRKLESLKIGKCRRIPRTALVRFAADLLTSSDH